jgi:hypothetical protein
MKKAFVIHPLLFAVYPVLFLFTNNLSQYPIDIVVEPIAVTISFTILCQYLLSFFLRDKKKTGLLISLFLFLFFSYGHVISFLGLYSFFKFIKYQIGIATFFLSSFGILFLLVTYFIIKSQENLHNLTNLINIIAASLVAFSLVKIGKYTLEQRSFSKKNTIRFEDIKEANPADLKKIDAFPDIYFIILDGYASSSTLKEVFNYDNSKFTDMLENKGFYVAYQSRSNHSATFLSLASSLNMKHLNNIAEILGFKNGKIPPQLNFDRTVPYRMIVDNKVMRFLKSKGYKFINFSSGWGPTNYNKYADVNIQHNTGNEFQWMLIQTTMFELFERKFNFQKNLLREKVLFNFSKIAQLDNIKDPKFVFAHILSPHPPYLFDANGDIASGETLDMKEWKHKDYIVQLIFINKKIEILVDQILSKSVIPPVIILQADHGPASIFSSIGWSSPTTNALRERMRIFSAYYLPGGASDYLYDSITPVNNFRLIFDFYFNTNYGLLDDQSYYSQYYSPYKFTNVTNRVKYGQTPARSSN